MTHQVDTALDRTFSEPPAVKVSDERTHCEACKEPLNPTVMHKCHGNKQYEPPVYSHTEITETCPNEACKGNGQLVETMTVEGKRHVVVCSTCRAYAYAPVPHVPDAILSWNAAKRGPAPWPIWLAALPGDDERNNVVAQPEAVATDPDLSNYARVCPDCKGTKGIILPSDKTPPHDGPGQFVPCEHCEGKGVIQ